MPNRTSCARLGSEGNQPARRVGFTGNYKTQSERQHFMSEGHSQAVSLPAHSVPPVMSCRGWYGCPLVDSGHSPADCQTPNLKTTPCPPRPNRLKQGSKDMYWSSLAVQFQWYTHGNPYARLHAVDGLPRVVRWLSCCN